MFIIFRNCCIIELEEKKPGGKVVENKRYAYNDSNQLAEATLCSGRTTRKVCYTYDADGNLEKEYSATGEPTYGTAAYENEYTYNGESYIFADEVPYNRQRGGKQ